ncbi:MAG: hypothetical protein FJ086_19205 [Deltaproteobacteria bacterium]|nr:hypothetical protein [Deltaproteobacteria bacterium]
MRYWSWGPYFRSPPSSRYCPPPSGMMKFPDITECESARWLWCSVAEVDGVEVFPSQVSRVSARWRTPNPLPWSNAEKTREWWPYSWPSTSMPVGPVGAMPPPKLG